MRMQALTNGQRSWLLWLHEHGGSGYLDKDRVIAAGCRSGYGSSITFLHLVIKGAVEGKDRRLVITDYGRRLLEVEEKRS